MELAETEHLPPLVTTGVAEAMKALESEDDKDGLSSSGSFYPPTELPVPSPRSRSRSPRGWAIERYTAQMGESSYHQQVFSLVITCTSKIEMSCKFSSRKPQLLFWILGTVTPAGNRHIPNLRKGKASSKSALGWDMLVPRRVDVFSIFSQTEKSHHDFT